MSPPIFQYSGMTCGICDIEHPIMRWTDTHGIACCNRCGAPYLVYHYEGDGADRRRVEKPAELLILPAWVAASREYWAAEHRNVEPGAYNFLGQRYEVATQADYDACNAWFAAYEERLSSEAAS